MSLVEVLTWQAVVVRGSLWSAESLGGAFPFTGESSDVTPVPGVEELG